VSSLRITGWIAEKLSPYLDKLNPVEQTEDLPLAARRYVLEEERKAAHISIRQHPAIMIPALTSALGVLLGAAFATVTGLHDSTLILVVWMISVVMILRSLLVVMRWQFQYIVITTKTFILTAGVITRTVTAIPLVNLSGMTLEMTPTGRLMGYAAFRLGADSPVQLVIDYVPYPEQLYLRIRNAIRAEQDKADAASVPSPADREPPTTPPEAQAPQAPQASPAAPVAQSAQPGRTRPAS
jgi:hypothetical protein